jgi:hypothetical protein
VVAVAVDAGRREDLGHSVEELEGGEAECGAASQVGLREEVEDLVGSVAYEMEPLECERGSGAVAEEPFEAGAVGGLDTNAPVQAEPTAVIPAEHVLGLVGLQEAVAAKMSEDPGADRVLEVFQELVGEGGGFVEAEVGFRMGGLRFRVILDPFEEPIDDDDVKVEVRIEAGAEAVQKTDRAH